MKSAKGTIFSDPLVLREALEVLISCAFLIAKDHGWHDEKQSDSECIVLMHAELSEAIEALRRGNKQDKHCPDFTALEVELADTVIRVFDFAGLRNIDLAGAIIAKMKYNRNRSYKHGDKLF